MPLDLLINVFITGLCLLGMGLYFNHREKKLHSVAEKRLYSFKDQYLHHVARRKVKEKEEIAKLKELARKLEEKHLQMIVSEKKVTVQNKDYLEIEVEKVMKQAQEKARQIEEETKASSQIFLEEQKKEVQMKMVDLVMGVTEKVLNKTLAYDDHKKMIEEALADMEGEDGE